MTKNNPIVQTSYIKKEFNDFIKSTFILKDKTYNDHFREQLEMFDIAKGPYLSVGLPFSTSKSIRELIQEGFLERDFSRLGEIQSIIDRKLYVHQIQALEKIDSGHNVVITTGTGSGKTEAFLYPIVNKILKEISEGENGDGVRAFFLFPMNALINDQLSRLRAFLSTYPSIRFGFFTGETEERESESYRTDLSREYGEIIPKNEVISREELRNSPPHLLFTNYSMLEYLLLRPNDFKLLSPESMSNWRFLVLDEAHTYRGALAIEIAMLIKRLVSRAEKKPQFILTSATLGKGIHDLDKIKEFATSLTSASYDDEDVIFATRDPYDDSKATHYPSPKIYHQLIENIEHEEKIESILNLKNLSKEKIAETLYDFLSTDKTLIDLLYASREPVPFDEMVLRIRQKNPIEANDLAGLIELISIARKNGKPLMDIKYHMFVRSPEGAYVTLDDTKKFRLINSKTIDGYKAFNIGICSYCKSTYVFGKIAKDILEQSEDVDISESFDDVDQFHIEYFIDPDCLTKIEIDSLKENEAVEKYQICVKCGHLHISNNLRARPCECGDLFQKSLYKVRSTHQVTTCPICESTNTRGIVDPFYIGKNSATALLAQIFYQSLSLNGNSVVTKKVKFEKEDFFSDEITTITGNDCRQFLAFSDSRQQAAFFARFFRYNDDRFLKKSSLYRALEENNHEPMKVSNLIDKLTNLYINNNVYEDDDIAISESRLAVLLELLKVDGKNSAENKGLYAFKVNIPLDRFSNENLNQLNERNNTNLTRETLDQILRIGLEIFRTVPAISYPIFGDQERRIDVLAHRRFYNYVALSINPGGKQTSLYNNTRSFLPIRGSNDFLEFIKKALKIDTEKAIRLVQDIWKIYDRLNIIINGRHQSGFQIPLESYTLHSYKKTDWYVCDRCNTFTHLNYKNICSNGDCAGALHKVDPDIHFAGEYYRRQYIAKPIERIRIEEHTAQLGSREARQYQYKFRNKQINILSSSTTFEMGIDIGPLSNIFLRNVPPLPSNYVQRAGRAGRRSDVSALILTYCNNTSHDFTYFKYPNPMIAGNIRPPYFRIDNFKIVMRHIQAAVLGQFFLENPTLMDSTESFIDGNGDVLFSGFIIDKLTDAFINKLENEIIPFELYDDLGGKKWIDIILKQKNSIHLMVEQIKELINMYDTAYQRASIDRNTSLMIFCQNQIDEIKKRTHLITHLSQNNVIPRYGFPVDNVDLKIFDPQIQAVDDRYRLTRDLSIAISEYAPDSDVIVDQHSYTSRYIILPPNKDLPRHYFHECPFCKRLNIKEIPFEQSYRCDYCHNIISFKGQQSSFVVPKYGFYADYASRTSTTQQPRRTYAGEIIYLGRGRIIEEKREINDHITVSRYRNDELLIINNNNFFMCDACGYTELKRNLFTPFFISSNSHKTHRGLLCPNKRLNLINLGHTYRTDVVVVEVDVPMNKTEALSTLYALLEGISVALEIERRDINGVITQNEKGHFQFIVFDTVPGGAGHTLKLTDKNEFLEALKEALFVVSGDCCAEETSCYSCLRSYSNQKIHNELSRGSARKIINLLRS